MPCAVAGLLVACQQSEAPPAAEAKAEAEAKAPAEAAPELVMTDGRVQVDITYCIP